MTLAPLEDPHYVPAHPPVKGHVPSVVALWGPRSQLRWFSRFRSQVSPMRAEDWDRFYCVSERHRGQCCESCMIDAEEGYGDWEHPHCCCRSYRESS